MEDITLRKLQEEHKEWSDRVFGPHPEYQSFLADNEIKELISEVERLQEENLTQKMRIAQDRKTIFEQLSDEKKLNDKIKEQAKQIEELEKFPKHTSRGSCNCQLTGPDVEHNRHIESCMVGQAQKYLGVKVTKQTLWGTR